METQIIYIALLTVIGSGIGAMTGFGIATIMTPMLLLFLPLPVTLLLVGIIHVSDRSGRYCFVKVVRWWLILAFGAPGLLTSFIGSYFNLFGRPERNSLTGS
jgi:uncharacterized protein